MTSLRHAALALVVGAFAAAGCGGEDDCGEPICHDAVQGGDLAVDLSWSADAPAVPVFRYELPDGASRIVLTVQEPPFVHTFTQAADAPEVGEIAIPLAPGVRFSWRLVAAVQGAEHVAYGEFTNGGYGPEALPPLNSTWLASAEPHRDYHLIPVKTSPYLGQAPADSLILIDEQARLLWMWNKPYPVIKALLDKDGRGVWTTLEVDVLDSDTPPAVTLDLWSWTGALLETYTVPATHHDFAFSPDQLHFNGFGFEVDPVLTERCGGTVYLDALLDVALETGEQKTVWRSDYAGFPAPGTCATVPDGFSYYYANGLNRVGDTLGITFGGGVNAFVVGTADGEFYYLDSANDGDLTVVADGDDLRDEIVRFPHSLVCTEGVDWGFGAPEGAVSCVGFSRGLFTACDTADAFWVDRSDLSAHYTASWPPPSVGEELYPACGTTGSHGNVGLIGAPSPGGDGRSRLAMYSSNTGVLQVLDLDAGAGQVDLALEYVIRPEEAMSLTGGFATSAPNLGAAHQITLAP